ncbi:MAG TPA: hypothetical protein VND64_19625 [Pirellulales bacterium]|nr:hypothetical protein [Pirellulales bacterium]
MKRAEAKKLARDDFDLDRLLATVATPRARETARRRWRTATRMLFLPRHLTGAWYWVPLPAGRGEVSWEVQVFFDAWAPSSDHVGVWKHVVDSLEYHWRRPLVGIENGSLPRGHVDEQLPDVPDDMPLPIDYASLPRGRVSRRIAQDLRYGARILYHGNDAPRGGGGLTAVRRAFDLPRSAAAMFDDHERCIAGQPEALSRALGIDLRIKGGEVSDLDWDEDERC